MAKEGVLVIDGIARTVCALMVENAVKRLGHADSATVNLTTGKMTMDYNFDLVGEKEVKRAIADAGYSANVLDPTTTKDQLGRQSEVTQNMWHKFLLSILSATPLLYTSMESMVGLWVSEVISMSAHPLSFASI